MEDGVIPWRKPWVAPGRGAYNRISGKKYSLLNQLILQHEGEYATFKQWSTLGGKIKKGAKSEIVVFWKWPESDEEKDDCNDENKKRIERPVLRYYRVFHISQVTGVEPLPRDTIRFEHDPVNTIEQVLVE